MVSVDCYAVASTCGSCNPADDWKEGTDYIVTFHGAVLFCLYAWSVYMRTFNIGKSPESGTVKRTSTLFFYVGLLCFLKKNTKHVF